MTSDMDDPAPPAIGAEPSAVSARDRPTIKLKPGKGGRFFAGAPWIYSGELAMDRRARSLAPGTIATLIDSARTPLATVTVNPGSRIQARRLDPDPEAVIDGAWLERKLEAALALRARLFPDARAYRWCHAEADGAPGLIIDRFGDHIAVQPNAPWLETMRSALAAALERLAAPQTIVWNGLARARALEGLDDELRILKGDASEPAETVMNGAVYMADLAGGQKTGLFLDQRDNHAFVARLAAGRRVLDVFSHVGGFSLAALAAGATSALAVDGSQPALRLAEEGARRMGAVDRFAVRRADAFAAMRALAEEGRRFDVVVCDPPAFAPNRGALEAGLRAYAKTARLGLALTEPGGVFVLCSCSHAATSADLEAAVGAALLKGRREGRLLRRAGAAADHPVHPHLAETEYLKCLTYAVS